MKTRRLIGIQETDPPPRFGILNSDGTVDSVYHHNDGYPYFLESHLIAVYDTEEKIREVMKGGDLYNLFSRHTNPRSPEYLEKVDNNPQKKSASLQEFLEEASNCCFAYHFDGKWHRHILCQGHSEWELTLIEKE